MIQQKKEKDRVVSQMALVGILGNVFLAVFKIFAGFFGHSAAMISDAIHTFSDVFATLIAFVGVTLSKKEADSEHPYGHERLECVASLLLAIILFATGTGIGFKCISAIWDGSYKNLQIPGVITVIAAIVSIVTKEAMFQYTMHYAKKYKSGAFQADAWHHRSDALSSIGALIGIIGARLGLMILDQIAGIIICIMILSVAIRIFKDAVGKMVDTSCDEKFNQDLSRFITQYAECEQQKIGLDLLRTRKFGEKIYVEMEINADGNLRLKDAHDIADRLHDAIEEAYPDIKHVMIHMNPAGYSYDVPTKL